MNTRQLNFAYKIRHALNENLDHLPQPTTDRLAAARRLALSRKKKESALRALFVRPVLSSQGAQGSHDGAGMTGSRLAWLGRMGVALPLLVVAFGLAGIYQSEQQRRITDTAEIDAEMLADELPISAYLDQGFNAFLAKRGD